MPRNYSKILFRNGLFGRKLKWISTKELKKSLRIKLRDHAVIVNERNIVTVVQQLTWNKRENNRTWRIENPAKSRRSSTIGRLTVFCDEIKG